MAKCIVCDHLLTKKTELFSMNNMPASAQNIPTAIECIEEKGIGLILHQCSACGLVQFDCVPVAYYRDVIRAGGGSSTMRMIRRAQYKKFIDRCNLTGKKILEIGAGKGEFLALFEGFNVKASGIEHNKEFVSQAQSNGLDVFEGFAEDEQTKIGDELYDAFTSFNFLEHQPNPNGMLQAIYNNLTDDGVGLITVPSFEYIVENDGFYELLRDHLAYYTFDTLTLLLNKNGFEVIDREIINRDTLAVIVRKRSRIDISKLIKSYEIISTELDVYIENVNAKDKGGVAIWGASHQGFTIAATLQLEERIMYIIDSAEFKQGKFAPASHIPIVSPDYYFKKPVAAIIIIAPGYTEEIMGIIEKRYGKDVQVAALKSNHLEILR